MSTTLTWPDGATGAVAASYSIPAAGELNWASLSNFLVALGNGAQGTTFQKNAIRVATTSPITVSLVDCVISSELTVPGAVAVNLPAGADKQVFYIGDGAANANTYNITITPDGSETIAGAASLVLATNSEGVQLVYNASDSDWKVMGRWNQSGGSIGGFTPSTVIVANGSGNLSSSSTSTTQVQYLNAATGTTGTTSTNLVFSTSPSLTTPILGTPQSGVLTNCTGLPMTTGVTGTLPVANGGTGVTTSTGSTSVVLSTSPTIATPTFTGQEIHAAGTVGAPSIAFTGDTNSGIYNVAADQVAVAVGGLHAGRFDVAADGTTTGLALGPANAGISNNYPLSVALNDTGQTGIDIRNDNATSGSNVAIRHIVDAGGGTTVCTTKYDGADYTILNNSSNELIFTAAGALKVEDGTASLPSHSFVDDTDTGMYRYGANNIGFAAGGVRTMVCDVAADGTTAGIAVGSQIGINNSYPLAVGYNLNGTMGIDIRNDNGTANAAASVRMIADIGAGGKVGSVSYNGSSMDIAADSGSMKLTNAGALQVGDGTLALPGYSFISDTNTGFYRIGSGNIGVSVDGVSCAAFDLAADGVTGGMVIGPTGTAINNDYALAVSYSKAGTTGMDLRNDGANAASATQIRTINDAGAGTKVMSITNDGTNFVVVNQSAGVYLSNGATSWTAVSDENDKHVLGDIENGLAILRGARAKYFRYTRSDIADDVGVRRIGLMAQDFKDILPEAVSVDKEGSLGLKYAEIIPVLVKGIQELDAYNKELFKKHNDSSTKLISFEDEARLRIKALELKAERLEARILALETP